MARALGQNLNISTKQSIEICNSIRKKSTVDAKRILTDAINQKVPIRFTRFTNGLGHRRGMASGRYPRNASKEILSLVEAAEANAQFKGLNTANLIINHVAAQNAGNQWRYGRHRRRRMKRTHVELFVEETVPKKSSEQTKKNVSPQKTEVKKETPPTLDQKQAPEVKKAAPKEDKKVEEVKKDAPEVTQKKELPKSEEKQIEKKAEPKKETAPAKEEVKIPKESKEAKQ